MHIILVLVSFLLGIVCIRYFRQYDIHEKEPFGKMALLTLGGGGAAFSLSLALYSVADFLGLQNLESAAGAFLVIAPVEELSKFFGLLLFAPFVRKDLNEPMDGLIYMGCVALGFSLLENYLFATATPDSGYLLLFRVFLCTPMHVNFSLFMGLSFFVLMTMRGGGWLFCISFAYAVLLHGLYNTAFFTGLPLLLPLLVVVVFSHGWSLSLLEYTSAASPFRISLRGSLKRNSVSVTRWSTCPSCGTREPAASWTCKKIVLHSCPECKKYITTRENLEWLVRFFGSVFKSSPLLRRTSSDLDKGVRQRTVVLQENLVSFSLHTLNELLEEHVGTLRGNMELRWPFLKAIHPLPPKETFTKTVE